MEDASILEPPRITAPSKAALHKTLEAELVQRSQGSYWLGEVRDDAYSIDVHHSYYIHEPGRVRCVHDAYPRLVSIPVSKTSKGFETRLPSMVHIRDRYREAERLVDRAVFETVTASFSPIVAVVGRTSGHLAKFEHMYVNRFQRGERLFPSRDLLEEYVVYLESQNIIAGDKEQGYALTPDAVNYIRDFRKRFPSLEKKHATEASPVPFMALCMKDWRFLGDELKLTTITSYFRLLTSIFDHHYRAKADPSKPQEHPISLDGIKRQMRRFKWGRQEDDDLRPRLHQLADVGAIQYKDDYVTWMEPSWYALGQKEVQSRIPAVFSRFAAAT